MGYDSDGNQVEKTSVNGQTKTITTGTDEDGNTYVSNDGITAKTTTDDFGRTTEIKTSRGEGNSVFFTDYEYAGGSAENSTTNLVSKLTQKYGTEELVNYEYTYDGNGNITQIYENGTLAHKYKYDSLNQLKEEYDYINRFYINYSYDSAGNLQSQNEQYLDSYGYPSGSFRGNVYYYNDTEWKDRLTGINGYTITYDESGNPLNYRDGMTFTWQNGRQLASLQTEDNSVTYQYDSDSVRISKTVNGVEYTYEYLNGMLLYETRGEDKFWYSYDANGTIYSMKYKHGDSSGTGTYYYAHNSRGDIIGIYTSVGYLCAKYEYDSWGNVTAVTDEYGNPIGGTSHIAHLNPFRYRGYYYDTESGLYYLMSRYYDPVTHRFINADGYFQSGGNVLDANMSAYCRNNPIMFVDPTGMHAISITCGDPTCTTCRQDRRDFINNNLSWYNRITGSNVSCVGYDGTMYYNEPMEYDFNSTESKVFQTIGAFVGGFEAYADVGLGFGYKESLLKVLNFDATSRVSLYIEFTGQDGFDCGTIQGSNLNVSVWDTQIFDANLSSSKSLITGEVSCDIGTSRTISIGKSVYFLGGASVNVGYNYGYFIDRAKEIW